MRLVWPVELVVVSDHLPPIRIRSKLTIRYYCDRCHHWFSFLFLVGKKNLGMRWGWPCRDFPPLTISFLVELKDWLVCLSIDICLHSLLKAQIVVRSKHRRRGMLEFVEKWFSIRKLIPKTVISDLSYHSPPLRYLSVFVKSFDVDISYLLVILSSWQSLFLSLRPRRQHLQLKEIYGIESNLDHFYASALEQGKIQLFKKTKRAKRRRNLGWERQQGRSNEIREGVMKGRNDWKKAQGLGKNEVKGRSDWGKERLGERTTRGRSDRE